MDGSGNSGKRKNSYTPNEGCLVFFKAKTCSAGACHNPGLYTTCGHLIKPRTVFIQSKGELPNVASSYAADPVTIFSQYPKSPALLSPTKSRFIFPVLTAVQSPSDEVVNDSRRARYTLHTLAGSDCDNYGTLPSAHYFHHQGTLNPVYKHGQYRSAFSLAGIKENEISSGFRGRELAPNTVHDKGIEMIQFPRKESLSERNWGNLAQHRGHRPRFQQQFDIKQPAGKHLPSTGHRSDSQEVCPKMVEALEDSFSARMGTTFQQREMKESKKGAPDQLDPVAQKPSDLCEHKNSAFRTSLSRAERKTRSWYQPHTGMSSDFTKDMELFNRTEKGISNAARKKVYLPPIQQPFEASASPFKQRSATTNEILGKQTREVRRQSTVLHVQSPLTQHLARGVASNVNQSLGMSESSESVGSVRQEGAATINPLSEQRCIAWRQDATKTMDKADSHLPTAHRSSMISSLVRSKIGGSRFERQEFKLEAGPRKRREGVCGDSDGVQGQRAFLRVFQKRF